VKANIIKTLMALPLVAMMTTTTYACSPAPSCWIASSRSYLRGVCRGFAKDKRTVAEIATFIDEPEKIQDFVRACKKLGITFKN
jgi:hypothetical protein